MKNIIITLLCLLCSASLSAQVSLEPKTIPAPNTSSLGEYGAIPVGHYTGIPQINIPLYELELDGMILPLSLSYHASGVKVSQEAGWVGMGWSLNAGGCITRSVQGWDDFGSTPLGYFWDSNPPQATEDNNVEETPSDSEREKYENIKKNLVDSEPDIFYFNFGSYSGRFFVQRQSESGNSLPKATVQTPNCHLSMDYDFDKWVVTDGDGFKFYFGAKEESQVRSIVDDSQCSSYSYYLQNKNLASARQLQPDITTAWYLDSIVSPNRHKLAFTYALEEVSTPMGMQETSFGFLKKITGDHQPSTPRKQSYSSYSYAMNKQLVLTKITGTNLSINFTGEARMDIEPRYADRKPTRLSEISISNTQSLLKRFKLGYYYTGTPDNYNNCRLFLSSLQELGTDGSLGGCYTMGYDNGLLPSKTSTDIDHWGYYTTPSSGMSSNCWGVDVISDNRYSTLIPPTTITYENTVKMFYGRNRNSNAVKMCYGILKWIKYPTGGQTSFTFEPNMVTSSTNVPPSMEQHPYEESFEDFYFSDLPMDNQDQFPDTWREGTPFEVASDTIAIFRLTIDYITGGDFTNETLNIDDKYGAALKKYNTSTKRYEGVKILSFPHLSESNGVMKIDYELILSPGTYRIDLSRSYSFNSLGYHEGSLEVFGNAACIVFKKIDEHTSNTTTIGGGVRIQQIETVDTNGNSTKKTYEYDGNILMTPLVYHYLACIAKSVVEVDRWGNQFIHYSLADYLCGMSSSYVPMSTAATGSFVGYNTVTETTWDQNSKQGSTVYNFYNDCDFLMDISDRFIPGFPTNPALSNGQPKQIIYYNSVGNPVRKEQYEYNFIEGTSIKGVKLYCPPMDTENTYIKFYDIYSSWNKPISKTIWEYSPSGELIWLTSENYTYDPTNYKLKELRVADSKSNISHRKVFEYPANLRSSASCYQQMVNRQMVNPVIEERNYIVRGATHSLLDTKRNLYDTFNDRLLPSSLLRNNETGSSTLAEHARITHYDKNGQPNDYIKGNIEKEVYLWGYNSMYPVAKIEGATYSEVESWLSAATINNLAANSTTVGAVLNSIRSTLANKGVLVTTYTYKPLVGMISMTAPNGEVTSYEYDTLGRLSKIKDHNGKILEQYDYHNKP